MEYQISNSHLAIKIKEKGAELAGILRKSDGKELMWQADPAHWGRHSCILFPIVGKVKEGVYQAESATYEMGQHGIARDLPFQLVERREGFLHLQLESSPETLQQYPYHFRLHAQYQLLGARLDINYTVENTDSRTIYFSVGAHPAFNCPVHAGASRSDYQLIFNRKEQAERYFLNTAGLFDGSSEAVLQNSNTLTLSESLFDKDALVFKRLQSDAVTLAHRSEGDVLTVHFPGFTHLGIWSKNRQSPFVCIEPWYGLADHVQHNQQLSEKEGIIATKAGQSFSCTHSVSVH